MDIKQIGNLIKTQDNRITDQPMFVVEKEVVDWGYDPEYCDTYVWVDRDEEYTEADDRKAEELNHLDDLCEDTGSWFKCYRKYRWEFVTACFTEQGCKDYIVANGHNCGRTRIYAHGSYRNSEYQAVRKILMDAA